MKLPLEYLRDLSTASTEAFMLKQLENSANLRKTMRKDMDCLVESLVNAEIAALLLRGDVLLPEEEEREKSA